MIRHSLQQVKQFYQDERFFFLVNVYFWISLSLFTFLKVSLFKFIKEETVYWFHIFSYTFTSGLLWIPFTVLIWWIAKGFHFQKFKLHQLVLLHILFSILISGAQRALSMSLDFIVQTKILNIQEFPTYIEYLNGHFARRWIEGIFWYILIAIVIYGYLQIRNQNKLPITPLKDQSIYFKKKGKQFSIPFYEIIYIKSKLNYCYIHTNQEVYKMRTSLKKLELDLIGTTIVRIHNSYLINSSHVIGFEHIQNGEYLFSLQNCIKRISSTKTYRSAAKEVINSL